MKKTGDRETVRLVLPSMPEGTSEFISGCRLPNGNIVFTFDATIGGSADGPSTWGLVLVDIAHHVADAAESRGVPREAALADVYELFEAEWEDRTGRTRPYPRSTD